MDKFNMDDGFLLIDKQEGWTSRDVCNVAQRLFQTRRVGHIGTLDPFATGLLILTINNGNKAGHFIDESDKTYEAILKLGEKTATGDLTSEVIENKEIPALNEDLIKEVFASFIGQREQIPPMTSALKVHGVRLYDLARQGQEVEIKSRLVEIKSLELISFSNDEIKFKCLVSKGTYVRVLGEEIAEALNTVGHLTSLRRLTIDRFSLEGAKYIRDVSKEDLIPISKMLEATLKIVCVNQELAKRIIHGQSLSFKDMPEKKDKILIVDEDYTALAVYGKIDGAYKCIRGLW